MKGMLVATLACAALVAGAPSLRAQGAPAKESTTRTMKHGDMSGMSQGNMAAEHKAMMSSQATAIRDAEAVERLARAKKLNLVALRRDADRAEDALQANIKRMDEWDKTASAEEKEHMTAVRTHEDEAVKHADELVAELKKDSPDAAAVETHAKAVVEHARLAEAARKTGHPKTKGAAGK